MKSIFSLCTGFSFHWFSKASTLFEMLGTSTVLELKGISHHSNSGEVTESKALRRILLRFLKNMGSIGTDLTAFIEALCQSPEVQLARELSDEEVAILPAPGVSVTDALRLYVETVEVLSRILD
ncbi:hypothetical protein J4Q44_G00197420 [Coregonus suidteri]|uniref:Uncharacterized protein n=1 Tax=Coregonus suidteri TaxID=861788 RepID=A0AAN8QSY0_9TELE